MLLMCFCILIILRTVIIAYVFTMNKGKQFDLAFFYMNRVYVQGTRDPPQRETFLRWLLCGPSFCSRVLSISTISLSFSFQ